MRLARVTSWIGCCNSGAVWRLRRIRRASCFLSAASRPAGPGRRPAKRIKALSIFERTYNHCMGMCASPDGRTIWLSSRYQIWRLEQAPANAVPYRPAEGTATEGDELQQPPQWVGRGYDVAYIPRVGYTTGHIDVHDLAVDADGRVIFVNTMFGCLATFSERANFQAALASAVFERPGSGGSLSFEWPGDARRAAGVCDGRQPLGRGGRLARQAAGRRVRAGCRLGRGGLHGPLDAALAALVSRPAVGAQFGHGRIRAGRSGERPVSCRSLFAPAICAG